MMETCASQIIDREVFTQIPSSISAMQLYLARQLSELVARMIVIYCLEWSLVELDGGFFEGFVVIDKHEFG